MATALAMLNANKNCVFLTPVIGLKQLQTNHVVQIELMDGLCLDNNNNNSIINIEQLVECKSQFRLQTQTSFYVVLYFK